MTVPIRSASQVRFETNNDHYTYRMLFVYRYSKSLYSCGKCIVYWRMGEMQRQWLGRVVECQ